MLHKSTCGVVLVFILFLLCYVAFKKICIGREERESDGPRESKNLKALLLFLFVKECDNWGVMSRIRRRYGSLKIIRREKCKQGQV
jgi:hypothetical protein